MVKHSCYCFTIWETVKDETSEHYGLKWSPDKLLEKGLPKDICFLGFQTEEGKQSKKQRQALYETLKAKNATVDRDSKIDIKQTMKDGEGRIHYQGYIQTYNNMDCTYKRIQNVLGCPWAWVKICRGSSDQNMAYITKLETSIAGTYKSLGSVQERQGYRSDWDRVADMANQGYSTYDITTKWPNKIPCIKAVEHYVMLAEIEKYKYAPFQKKEVVTIWGEAGLGKTRHVYDKYHNEEGGGVFTVEPTDDGKIWFDGYWGQKTIILDDFNGSMMKTGKLLRFLDGYRPQRLPIKGGSVISKAERIYITSNHKPETWYTNGVRKNLGRRITKCYHITQDEFNNTILTNYDIQISTGASVNDGTHMPTHPMYGTCTNEY